MRGEEFLIRPGTLESTEDVVGMIETLEAIREGKPMQDMSSENVQAEPNEMVDLQPTTTDEDHTGPKAETRSKGQWLNSMWGMQNKASKIIRALDGIVGPPEELAGKEDLPKNVCAAQDLVAEMWLLSSMLERIEEQVGDLQEYIDWQ